MLQLVSGGRISLYGSLTEPEVNNPPHTFTDLGLQAPAQEKNHLCCEKEAGDVACWHFQMQYYYDEI